MTISPLWSQQHILNIVETNQGPVGLIISFASQNSNLHRGASYRIDEEGYLLIIQVNHLLVRTTMTFKDAYDAVDDVKRICRNVEKGSSNENRFIGCSISVWIFYNTQE